MDKDHKHGDQPNTLPGENIVPLLHGPLTKAEQSALEEKREQEAEKQAEIAYKERQLALSSSANKLSKTNVILTWVLALFTAMSAVAGWYQGRVASRSATAAESAARAAVDSVYMACLTAQATQDTLIQVQRNASDSHASTVAAVEQAKAGIISEQASISLLPRFPNPEELFNNQLAIPFSIKNTGKSEARDLNLQAKAVILGESDSLSFSGNYPAQVKAQRIPAGYEFPEKPTDPKYHAVTETIPVRSASGEHISSSSQIASDFLSGSKGLVAVYGHMAYFDSFGLHKAAFCIPVFIMRSGTTRASANSEANCARYNHQEDRYTEIPKIDVLPPMATNPLQPISCIKPAQ